MPQIIPLFPDDIDTFLDLFGGGFNVGVNVNCRKVIYNDICSQVVDLLKKFYIFNPDDIHTLILSTIGDYGLHRGGHNRAKEYLSLRDDYNENPNWLFFYVLISCSFSNQIRFNSKGKFNMPYGKREYNDALQRRLQQFVTKMQQKEIGFMCEDFRKVCLNKDIFIYADPPYYNSVAPYNEQGRWSDQDERELLLLLDNTHAAGGRFALSNNLKYDNPLLKTWMEKYNVHYLNGNYGNCNYQKKNRSGDIEVLITNY